MTTLYLPRWMMQLVAHGAQDTYLTLRPELEPDNYGCHDNEAERARPTPRLPYVLVQTYKRYGKRAVVHPGPVCTQCGDAFVDADRLAIWSCGHAYHRRCHHQFISHCPVCEARPGRGLPPRRPQRPLHPRHFYTVVGNCATCHSTMYQGEYMQLLERKMHHASCIRR